MAGENQADAAIGVLQDGKRPDYLTRPPKADAPPNPDDQSFEKGRKSIGENNLYPFRTPEEPNVLDGLNEFELDIDGTGPVRDPRPVNDLNERIFTVVHWDESMGPTNEGIADASNAENTAVETMEMGAGVVGDETMEMGAGVVGDETVEMGAGLVGDETVEMGAGVVGDESVGMDVEEEDWETEGQSGTHASISISMEESFEDPDRRKKRKKNGGDATGF